MAAALPACYHGSISRQECETLLGQKNKDGAYLIRNSETIQGAMCLCVYKQRVVYTYRLLQSHSGHYTLVTSGGLEETFFKSLNDLIRHYKRKNQGLAMHLRHSIKRKTAILVHPQKPTEKPPEEEPGKMMVPVAEEDHCYESMSFFFY
uniref:SH2 domain-containing protein n=1 Tax=Monopterus albus TaxID=43700 RepID=A0A3Q3JX19_MONAL